MTLKHLHWEKAGTETVVMDKILCVCIGTGAGSAFVENGKTVKTGKGVPENGWIYQQPFEIPFWTIIFLCAGWSRLAWL